MFGSDFFDALIGLGVGLLMAGIHLALQMQSQNQRLDWREPLVLSGAIAASMGVVVAVGGIINGDGGYALRDAVGVLIPMFLLIAAGSFAGRGIGWALQWVRDRL